MMLVKYFPYPIALWLLCCTLSAADTNKALNWLTDPIESSKFQLTHWGSRPVKFSRAKKKHDHVAPIRDELRTW